MIIIAHRGNISGPISKLENNPEYVVYALKMGYHCEVDVWFKSNKWYLGHDKPQYLINDVDWLLSTPNLWLHCKNIEALISLQSLTFTPNYFFHQEDDYTLTSHRYIWAYPNRKITSRVENAIAVMPTVDFDVSLFGGVCTDWCTYYD